MYQRQMRDLVAADDLPNLTEPVDISERYGSHRARFHFGHAAFDFMKATYGKGGMRRFVRQLASSVDHADALYGSALDVTPAEFDRAFAADPRAGF